MTSSLVHAADLALHAARALSRWATWVGGLLLVASAILVAVEVVLRKGFVVSIGGADELSGYAFAISTSWALAFALIERAHIRVDALYVRLPTRLCAILDIVALATLGLFAVALADRGIDVLATSLRFGSTATTPLQTPLWLPQGLWVGGLVLFVVVDVLLLVRALVALGLGDLATVGRIAGIGGHEDEVDRELSQAREGR